MIEYTYSRILVTIASAALVAVVISAGYGASEQAAFHCTERVADGICEAVESASEMEAESYEHRVELDAESSPDLYFMINSSYVEVHNGGYSVTRSFSRTVGLMAGGTQVGSISVLPGSGISIKACRDPLAEENVVTIELIAA